MPILPNKPQNCPQTPRVVVLKVVAVVGLVDMVVVGLTNGREGVSLATLPSLGPFGFTRSDSNKLLRSVSSISSSVLHPYFDSDFCESVVSICAPPKVAK